MADARGSRPPRGAARGSSSSCHEYFPMPRSQMPLHLPAIRPPFESDGHQPIADLVIASLPSMAHILIVEDNPDLAYGLRTGLEIEGYEVDVAEDRETGLARAQQSVPD